ncbi:MAG: 2-polyprenyl-3-methyl-5-hydroxy-6-metoxy-1,4-benzoquinol methylase, partial [Phenylobacterium sp.]
SRVQNMIAQSPALLQKLTLTPELTCAILSNGQLVKSLGKEEKLRNTQLDNPELLSAFVADSRIQKMIVQTPAALAKLLTQSATFDAIVGNGRLLNALLADEKTHNTLLNQPLLVEPLLSDSRLRKAIEANQPLLNRLSNTAAFENAILANTRLLESLVGLDEMQQLLRTKRVISMVFSDEPSLLKILALMPATPVIANGVMANGHLIRAVLETDKCRNNLLGQSDLIGLMLQDSRLHNAIKNDGKLLSRLTPSAELFEAVLANGQLVKALGKEQKLRNAQLDDKAILSAFVNDSRVHKQLVQSSAVLDKVLAQHSIPEAVTSNGRLLGAVLASDKARNTLLSDAELVNSLLGDSRLQKAAQGHAQLLARLIQTPELEAAVLSNSKLIRVLGRNEKLQNSQLDDEIVLLQYVDDSRIQQMFGQTSAALNKLFEQPGVADAVIANGNLFKTILANEKSHNTLLGEPALVDKLLEDSRLQKALLKNTSILSRLMSSSEIQDAILSNGRLIKALAVEQKLRNYQLDNEASLTDFVSDSRMHKKLLQTQPALVKFFEQEGVSDTVVANSRLLKLVLAAQKTHQLDWQDETRISGLLQSEHTLDGTFGKAGEGSFYRDSGQLIINGWFLPNIGNEIIYFYDQDGKLLGHGNNQQIRTDIHDKYPWMSNLKSGWRYSGVHAQNPPSQVYVVIVRNDKVLLWYDLAVKTTEQPFSEPKAKIEASALLSEIQASNHFVVNYLGTKIAEITLFSESEEIVGGYQKQELVNMLSKLTAAEIAQHVSFEYGSGNSMKKLAYDPVDYAAIEVDEEYDVIKEQILHYCERNKTFFRDYLKGNEVRIYSDYLLISRFIDAKASVLDIGGNPPMLAGLLKHHIGCRVTVADPQVEIFEGFYANSGLHSINMDLLKHNGAEAEALGTYDFVSFCEVFEHLTGNIIESIAVIDKLVAEDGLLYLTTPNQGSFSGLYGLLVKESALASKYTESVYEQYEKYEKYGYFGHVREYTGKEVVVFFQQHGYELVESKTIADYRNRSNQTEVEKLVVALEHVVDGMGAFGKYLFRKTACQAAVLR